MLNIVSYEKWNGFLNTMLRIDLEEGLNVQKRILKGLRITADGPKEELI